MGFSEWLANNWFSLAQTLGIIAGLVFTGLSFRQTTKAQQAANFITFKKEHRYLWEQLYAQPELARIFRTDVDLASEPLTEREIVFLKLLVAHLSTFHLMLGKGLVFPPDSIRKDVSHFFSLPLPREFWRLVKDQHDPKFVRFVEAAAN